MMRLTLEIVAKTLFDAEIGGETADASAAMETLTHAFIARTGNLTDAAALDSDAAESSYRARHSPTGTHSRGSHRQRRAERRGPWRFAVDASAGPGR